MISVPPPHRKLHLRLLLFLSCWLVMIASISQASITTENLAADLASAQEALDNEDTDRAERVLRNLVTVAERNASVHRLLGCALLKKSLPDAAIVEFSTALQIEPQDELSREYLFSIYYNRAQILLDMPQEAYKAREALEMAIRIRPEGIMAYYFLGTLNYQEKRDAECITTLLKLIDSIPEKLRPNLHFMLYKSAYNLLNQKRAHEAKEVIPYFSTPPQATINELLLTATLSLEVGDFAKSTELYDRVLSKEPLHSVARHNRGIAQQRLEEVRHKEAGAALPPAQNSESPAAEELSKPSATAGTSKSYK